MYKLQDGGITVRSIFLCLICVLLTSALPFVAGAIKDEALVLYLPFDEGAGETVKDLSGNDNDGTVQGDVEWTEDGKMGSAMFFKEQVQQGVLAVKASESLAITQSLTMEVWVYPQSVGAYRNVRGQSSPWTYYLSIHQSRPSVWIGTDGAGGRAWLTSDSTIPVEEWSHIAAVYDFDKGELRFYINGDLDATHAMAGEIASNLVGDHEFGNRLDQALPYKGRLDEFAIYNRALTEAEIREDMNGVLADASVSPSGKLTKTWGHLKTMHSF